MALSKVSTNQIDTAATPTVAEATVTGDLTVDTNTLHVDAANNNVGIGTTSIEDFGGGHVTLEVAGSTTTQGGVFKTATLNSAGSGSTGEEMIMYTSSSGGTINVVTSDPLRFLTANTERGRFLAGGGLTFNGDTAAANALDDYEEGVWSPTITRSSSNPSLTTSYNHGTYVKIGRLVYYHFLIIVTAVSSNGSGNSRVSGLPYTAASSTSQYSQIGQIGYNDVWTSDVGSLYANGTTLQIIPAGVTQGNLAQNPTTGYFAGAGWYTT